MRIWLVAISSIAFSAGLVLFACGDTAFTGKDEDASVGSDAAVTSDSSNDAEVVGDAPTADGASPCNATHVICDDFDRPVLNAIWQSATPGCALPTLDNSAYVSPTQSLAATNDAGQYDCAYFSANIATAKKAHCEADVRFDVLPPQFFGFFKIVTQFDDVSYYEAAIEYKGQPGATGFPILLGDDAIVDGGPQYQSTDLKLAGVDGWFHVSLEVDFGAELVTAVVNGVGAKLTPTRTPSNPTGQQMVVRVGFEYQGAGGRGAVRYDNVFCDDK